MGYKFLPGLFLFLAAGLFAAAQPQPGLELFASGFDAPIGIVNAGDSRLFVIEQRGQVHIVDEAGAVTGTPFLDLSDVVSQSGFETGLLGLAFHPGYSENGYFYVNYTRQNDGTTVVSRFSVHPDNPSQADPESEVQLFTVDQPYSNHNGGQLLFGPDGYLYIALGDGGDAGDPHNNGQDLSILLGKMLRIDVNADNDSAYVIPPDNPFVGDAGALDEIWAYGLRNPWRNSFDRHTGDLWIADVGQNSFEEVNFQPAGSSGGENYGWRCYEADMPFNTENCEEASNYVFPVFSYPHEGQSCSGSVTGGYVYRGALYSAMYGVYIMADFCTGNVYTVTPVSDGFEGAGAGNFGAAEVTSFGEDQYGELYVVKQNAGEIYKLIETGECKPAAVIESGDTSLVLNPDSSLRISAVYHPDLNYQWYLNNEALTGETLHELEITDEGVYTVEVTNPANGCSSLSDSLVVNAGVTSARGKELNGIKIYPNPASDILRVEGLPVNGKSRISLFGLNGTSLFEAIAEKGSFSLHVARYPAGMYYLRIVHDTAVFQEKVLIRQP